MIVLALLELLPVAAFVLLPVAVFVPELVAAGFEELLHAAAINRVMTATTRRLPLLWATVCFPLLH